MLNYSVAELRFIIFVRKSPLENSHELKKSPLKNSFYIL